MSSFRVIALTAALALLSPLGIASAQPQQTEQQRQQAEERRQAMEERQEAERKQDAERRQEMEQRQEQERRQAAEQRQDAERRQDGVARAMAPGQVRAEEMVGLRVVNRQNNKGLGKVAGLVTDRSGQIEAVVIDYGGFLGLFTKSVTVPWNQLELSADGETVLTNLDRAQLRGSPPYKRD